MKDRTPRQQLLFYLDIIDLKTNELIGHLGDISADGLMILTENLIPSSKIKHISIHLPDFEEFSQKSIEAFVEIRWTKPDINPDLHCIGCRFINIDPDLLPIIKQVEEVLGNSEVIQDNNTPLPAGWN
ncbi:MAG: PilZ domain-containing protein [Thiomargarita sp.]|nr:PilZ domain-containing protein [Thiomargarita sp.]